MNSKKKAQSGWIRQNQPTKSRICSASRLSAIASGLITCLGACAVQAGTLTTDFSDDPGTSISNKAEITTLVRDGALKLVDLNDLINPDTGQFQDTRLPLQGSYILPEIDAGQLVGSFHVTFKARVGGGTEQGAQGFSLVFANDYPTGPFREGGGPTTGFTISFDELDAPLPLAGAAGVTEGNDPGDAPGIIIKQKGQKVIAKKFAGLRSDGPGAGHNPVFIPVDVNLTADGLLTLTYNGTKVYDNVPVGYIPIAGSFGFGAGTEEQTSAIRDNFWIDDLSITTTTVSGAYVVSVDPPTQNAPPDATINIGVQDLGTAAVQLLVDGTSVTPVKTDAGGGLTTITYRAPSLYNPGSSHTVKLTYGAKSFQYAFTVSNAPVIPATAAAAAGSVDTTKTGFKVSIYQTDATQTVNSTARAEQELAGDLGPNTADLSAAGPDGKFDQDVINMSYDGAGAGDIDGDINIVGTPGNGSDPTGNLAMEAIGFLDLKAGAYNIGAVSDDSIKVTIGAEPRDITATTLFEIPIGRASSPFIIQQSGIYPFRAIWTQGGGPANIELWSQDAAGNKTLLNDPNTPGSIKSYSQRVSTFKATPYLSGVSPLPGEVNVSIQPKLELDITDASTTLDPNSVKVTINGTTITVPSSAITKNGNVSVVKPSLAGALQANTLQQVKIDFKDSAGTAISRNYSFTTGKATGGSSLNSVKGYWTFNQAGLGAVIGRDMEFVDPTLADRYLFGTSGQGDFANVPLMGGKPAKFIKVPYVTDGTHTRMGLKVKHDIAPNGGGKKVNQFTAIMDVMWGDGSGYGAVWQLHDLANGGGDSDMYWQASSQAYGKSCCSTYTAPNKKQDRFQWARVVFAVDLSANPPVLAKYIDGVKNYETITGSRGHVDSEFALSIPEIVLFGDSDNENSDAYLSAFQIREGKMTDEEVAALGAADPNGIPLPYSEWNFPPSRPLQATVGNDLQYVDSTYADRYKAGVTGQGDFANVPLINGKPANVLLVPYVTDGTHTHMGLRLPHGLAPNGGGQKVNQYTVVMDLLWGDGSGYGALWQLHDLANGGGDSDMYWQASSQAYGKSCCSTYTAPNKKQDRWQWARVAFAVDLSANPPLLAKYIDGIKNYETITGSRGHVDSEFALSIPEIVLFGDSDNENSDAYISHLQVRQGKMTDDEIAALGAASAFPIPSPNPVKGEWNFDEATHPLAATVGDDMQFVDSSLADKYTIGVTGSGDLATVPGINGQPTGLIKVPYLTDPANVWLRMGLRVPHGMSPNGGGQKVNQYTAIMDIMWGDGSGYGALWQLHDLANGGGDSDMYWQASSQAYGKSCCSTYSAPNQKQDRWQWARVAFAVDLSANPPILAKYINGVKNFETISGSRGHVDSEFAFSIPEIVLFGDSDNETSDAYLSAFQVREGRMSDEDIAALGGPDAGGIPGASIGATAVTPPPKPPQISLTRSGANITISWPLDSVGFILESSPSVPTTSWSAVAGVANNSVVIQAGEKTEFYRLRK